MENSVLEKTKAWITSKDQFTIAKQMFGDISIISSAVDQLGTNDNALHKPRIENLADDRDEILIDHIERVTGVCEESTGRII